MGLDVPIIGGKPKFLGKSKHPFLDVARLVWDYSGNEFVAMQSVMRHKKLVLAGVKLDSTAGYVAREIAQKESER